MYSVVANYVCMSNVQLCYSPSPTCKSLYNIACFSEVLMTYCFVYLLDGYSLSPSLPPSLPSSLSLYP